MSQQRDDEERATAVLWSLRALRVHSERLRALRKDPAHEEEAFVTAAQGVWWTCALDEQASTYERPGYGTRRDNDQDGKVVKGLRWLRDRHTHQVPVTIGRDETHFFPGPPFHIAASGFIWVPRSLLPHGDHHDNDKWGLQTAYDEQISGRSCAGTLSIAVQWFEREATVEGSLVHFATQFEAGLPDSHFINWRDR